MLMEYFLAAFIALSIAKKEEHTLRFYSSLLILFVHIQYLFFHLKYDKHVRQKKNQK